MDRVNTIIENKDHSSVNLFIVDNFYENPIEIRNFALNQNYFKDNYYPGNRTKSFSNILIKDKIQKIIEPSCGKIIDFPLYDCDNGTFQYNLSNDNTWIHRDKNNINMAGILYLTPNAPISSGTTFYKFKNDDLVINNNYSKYNTDYSKWEVIDNVGNIFNRLILFNSNLFHCSTNYFGNDINDGRLIQLFFFSTEF